MCWRIVVGLPIPFVFVSRIDMGPDGAHESAKRMWSPATCGWRRCLPLSHCRYVDDASCHARKSIAPIEAGHPGRSGTDTRSGDGRNCGDSRWGRIRVSWRSLCVITATRRGAVVPVSHKRDDSRSPVKQACHRVLTQLVRGGRWQIRCSRWSRMRSSITAESLVEGSRQPSLPLPRYRPDAWNRFFSCRCDRYSRGRRVLSVTRVDGGSSPIEKIRPPFEGSNHRVGQIRGVAVNRPVRSRNTIVAGDDSGPRRTCPEGGWSSCIVAHCAPECSGQPAPCVVSLRKDTRPGLRILVVMIRITLSTEPDRLP